ncbi:MAG: hypothetical protein IKB85_01495 [Bacteroidales bacterium]|nr:hypothetical protein [Bacteroidales bacterium]
MFKKYFINDPKWGGQQWAGSMVLSLPSEEFENEDYFILPNQSIDSDYFYRKVQYVDNVATKTRDSVIITPNEDGTYTGNISFGEIGRYKHRRWAFQNETRFALTIFPFNPIMCPNQDDVGTLAFNACLQNKELAFTKYFMSLDERILDKMEITLSPSATEGQRTIVDALVRLYAPNAIVKSSSLGHLVKI